MQKETNDQRDHRKPVRVSRNGALRERGGKSQVHRCARCGALIIVRIANRAHQKRARKLSSAQTIPAACRDRTPPSISNRLAFFCFFYLRALLFQFMRGLFIWPSSNEFTKRRRKSPVTIIRCTVCARQRAARTYIVFPIINTVERAVWIGNDIAISRAPRADLLCGFPAPSRVPRVANDVA